MRNTNESGVSGRTPVVGLHNTVRRDACIAQGDNGDPEDVQFAFGKSVMRWALTLAVRWAAAGHVLFAMESLLVLILVCYARRVGMSEIPQESLGRLGETILCDCTKICSMNEAWAGL